MPYIKEFRQAMLLTLVMLALCGLAYPLAMVGIGGVLAPEKAGGSLVMFDGQAIGSELVGQTFSDPRFMRGRPSAVGYNMYTPAKKADGTYTGVASGSANMAPSNPALAVRVTRDMQQLSQTLRQTTPDLRTEDIPTDLLTASGSGLDPHISPASAQIQVPALARHSGLSKDALTAIIARNTTPRWGGVLGEATVHVLKVNRDIARELGIHSQPALSHLGTAAQSPAQSE